ncbi:MAG: putative transport system permease protein [Acidobacteriota bacterium]|jgi:predicted permease|nr:putative transport system permease protein [Acidobacteriota bacterium]
MSALFKDLRYGARVLFKNPRFTLVAVVTLALGIGANTAIFSVVHAVLMSPLPYPEPERLVRCYWQWPNDDTPVVTGLEYSFWKENSRALQETAAFSAVSSGANLVAGGEPERVRTLRVSEGFFRVLGVGPTLGRGFSPEEDQPNGPLVAVISDGLWRRYFGGDRSVVGRQVQLNGRTRTILGVMPPEFRFELPVDVLIPLQLSVDPTDQGHNTGMLARLKRGAGLPQAQADVAGFLPEFRKQFPAHAEPAERGIRLVPYQEHIVGDVGTTLWLLFAAVGFVLLITCVNISNLMLARSAAREHEIAIRTALGAGRWRLVRQLLTESILLALAGGFAGLLLAWWCMPALLAISPKGFTQLAEINMGYQTMLFTACVSALTSLLFGVLPALRLTRVSVSERLKDASGRGVAGRRSRLRRGLPVVSEVALAFVLLLGAALLIKSFVKLHEVELGFNPENLSTMQVALTSQEYSNTERAWQFQRNVLDRISRTPGVVSAATVSSLPMERGLNVFFTVAGRDARDGRLAEYRPVSPGYFRAMGIATVGGRTFTDDDMRSDTKGVVVNEHLAHLSWPGGDPLGQELTFENQRWQIIGVVSDIREKGLDKPVEPTLYVPMSRVTDAMTVSMNRWFLTTWLVRTSGPVALGPLFRDAVRQVDPKMPVATVRPMSEVISASVASQRFVVLLMGIFAGLALLLTTVGLYGLLSYQVSQRTREIGVRMALGARPRDVMILIVGQGVLLTLAGICLGLVGALAGTRLIAGLLFGVSPTDPATFVAVTLLLTFIALLACYFPAHRATKVDPMTALRND